MLQLLCHRGCLFFLQSRECASLIWSVYPRVTSAAIARSPRGALATRADQKGANFFVVIRLISNPSLTTCLVSAGTSHVIAPALAQQMTGLREGCWSLQQK